MFVYVLVMVALGGPGATMESAITHGWTSLETCGQAGVLARQHLTDEGYDAVGFTCKKVEIVFTDEGEKL